MNNILIGLKKNISLVIATAIFLGIVLCKESAVEPDTGKNAFIGFPEKIVPNINGAHVHLNTYIDYGMQWNSIPMNQFREAGFSFARLVIPWFDVERTKGVYDFSNNEYFKPGYKSTIEAFASRGVRPIITVLNGNDLYGQSISVPITSTEGLKAFENYCRAVAKEFKEYNPIFEVWNEPNLSNFGAYTGEQYVALVKSAKKGFVAGWKESGVETGLSDPIVIGPAVANSWARGNMMDDTFDAGLLDIVDGLSFHPYMNKHPNEARRIPEIMPLAVTSLREELARRGKLDMPLVLTEWGWSSHLPPGSDDLVSEETQAKYHVRQILMGYYAGLDINCIYSMADARNKDQRGAISNKHYGMFETTGSRQKKLTAKPSIDAVTFLNKNLSGYKYIKRINMGDTGSLNADNDWCLIFWNPITDVAKAVIWTTEKNTTKTSPDLKSLIEINSSVVVDFTDSPVYVPLSGYDPS